MGGGDGVGTDGAVGAEAVGEGLDLSHDVLGQGVQHQLRLERRRHLAAQLVRLAQDHPGTPQVGDGGVQAADGPGAHDQHGVTERGADVLVAGLHRAQRLAECALGEAQRVGHLVDGAAGERVGREDAVLGQAARRSRA